MASEIRVDKINSLSGVGTVTLSPTGVDIAGITTAATLRATTGIVTSLTAGSLTSLGAVSGTTGTFSGDISVNGGDVTVTGGEGTSAALQLIADQGDDNGDGWEIRSNQDDNDLTIKNNTSGSYVDKFTLLKTGELTLTSDLTIPDKIIHTGDTNTAIRFPAADTITAETGGSERIRIDSSGRFMLNMSTSVTGGKFQVDNTFNTFFASSNDTQGCVVQLEKTRSTSPGSYTIVQDGDTLGELQFKGSNGSASVIGANIKAIVNGTPGSGNDLPTDLAFRTMPDGSGSTVERMRIDSSGRVIIGATSTIGNTYSNNFTVSEDAGNVGMQFAGNNSTSNYASIYFGDAGHRQRHYIETQLGTNGNFTIGTIGTGIFRFANSGGEKVRFAAAGGITFNGDTAAANTLDDYEEGTFTPAMNQGINVSSYTNQDGHYVKVGNLVQVSFRIQLSGSGSSNHVRFQGLPFNSTNTTNYHSGGIVTYTNIDGLNGNGTMSVWMGSNNSLCELYRDGNSSAATGSGGFTNKEIYIVLTYRSD